MLCCDQNVKLLTSATVIIMTVFFGDVGGMALEMSVGQYTNPTSRTVNCLNNDGMDFHEVLYKHS